MNYGDVEDLSLALCTHKEADTRLFLHVAHAPHCGYGKIMISHVDTDVILAK